MQRLIFSLSAQRDLNEIFDYIERDKPIAASNWIGLIEEKCKLIAETPEFGETRHEYGASIRSSTIGRYVIFYRPFGDGIEVVRIVSGDRDIRSL